MRRLGTAKALLWVAALCAVLGVVPAQATTRTVTAKIEHVWGVSPNSGETLNSFMGQGAFGWTVNPDDLAFQFGDHCFTLSATDTSTDFDVYFYIGTSGAWNYEAGANQGAERGQIPKGATKAFVMISPLNPGAMDVSFTLRVFDATSSCSI